MLDTTTILTADAMPIATTKHADRRSKERLGLGKRCAQKNAKKAYENGLSAEETTGKIQKFLSGVIEQSPAGRCAKLYHRYIYIFAEETTLVTVMPLPRKFIDHADKAERRANERRTWSAATQIS